jgi:carboxymethylenebutenolidase
MSSTWEELPIDGSRMRTYVSVPEGRGRVPGLIVIHGQSGVENFIKDATHMLALQGYTAAAPDLFHRDGPDCKDDGPTRRARLRDDRIIKDVNTVAQFLKSHDRVDPARLGIVGFCMGGRVVYLMSAASRDLKAAVMFYGGNIMSAFGDGPSPFERTREISCPIQGHFGEEDENPSPADMRKLDAELARWDKPHEFYSYARAAHAFANTTSPNYRPHAAAMSWPRATEFFRRHLVAAR